MNYISVQKVMDDLLVHPLLQDLPYERVINYTVEFIRIVGMPKLFIQKTVQLHIDDYRCLLPCDYYKEVQIRDVKSQQLLRKTSSSFDITKDYSSDIQYKVQGDILYTSMREHDVDFSYEALPVDDEGYPLLLDNAKFIRALEAYIKYQWFTILFDVGKITQQAYQNAKRDYSFYVGQAQTDLIKPNIDEMRNITNMWNQLLHKPHESNGFRVLGKEQQLNIN